VASAPDGHPVSNPLPPALWLSPAPRTRRLVWRGRCCHTPHADVGHGVCGAGRRQESVVEPHCRRINVVGEVEVHVHEQQRDPVREERHNRLVVGSAASENAPRDGGYEDLRTNATTIGSDLHAAEPRGVGHRLKVLHRREDVRRVGP
jgi:hypothetical protein